MKVPRHIVEARRKKLADLLQRHRYLSIQELCQELGVSEATARRDLASLQTNQMVTRTYGGALADYNLRFPSFRQRRSSNAEAKRTIAQRAYDLLKPEMTVFLDAGTTVFAVAELLRDHPIRPLTCVTSSMPAADLLAEVQGISVHLLGGQLLHRQSVMVGKGAMHAAGLWKFDLAICCAQGMTAEGLWNSQQEVVDLQRALIAAAARHVFLVDSSKLGRRTEDFLLPWDKVDGLFTDADAELLLAAGIRYQLRDFTQLSPTTPSTAAAPVQPASAVPPKKPEQHEKRSDLTLPVSLL